MRIKKRSFPSQNKETQVKTEEMYGKRFADDINMEASWLVAHTLTKWVQTTAPPLTSTVTLGKCLNLSEPQFQHIDNFLKGLLGGLNERNLYKLLPGTALSIQ